ncbi:A24 family peptidase [Nitratireductor indicus]|uniref:Peptidase A24A, prepilin type IV n=1 Tax=Nitratireductor indicus C115 TaxID=1231190 RepID=K2NYJ7_9HYPH|nr:prepilin peptidase [Nitratireductor indicus]EKF44335.1 peptidase A24A, prepilin type IV [Nitratireductor indicus C115]MDS1137288.1 prepilin peptidase [Nitratireductor indicus]SFQ27660.1 prepilin peptidase CpaA [Nitratireductor indicus]
MLEAAIFVIFPFCMAFAAVSDMLSMTIANRVSVLLIVAFLVIAPFTGMAWSTIGLHLAAVAAVLAVTFALFAIGGMGGGDAKLIAATSIWFGFSPALVEYLALASVVGGALTLAILSFRNSPLSLIGGNNLFLKHFANTKVGVPYGIALGVAGLLAFPQSPLTQWAIEKVSAF